SSLDGSNGFVLNGIDAYDGSGGSVSSAGDVNGDGIDDLIIGASGADQNGGESYVVFGSSDGFAASFELSSLDGSNGFVLNGIDADDLSGSSVSSAGDVNGDGLDDLIIGARFGDPSGADTAGEGYVVFGSSDGFAASFELSSLDGSNGFVLNGIDAYDGSGGSVSSAGDVNGDGFDDLIIGAQGGDTNGTNTGESYVVFGRATFEAVVNVGGDAEGDVLTDIENLTGSDFNDVLTGNDLTNILDGAGGDDLLVGGAGDDVIFGGSGLDQLTDGLGSDMLTGGADADVFIITEEVDGEISVTDTITDFEDNVDTLDLTAFSDGGVGAGFSVIDDGIESGTTILDLGNGQLVVVENILFSDLADDIDTGGNNGGGDLPF
ncbi:MAG: hypothetical protein MRY72_00735, partial [Aquisalinus sp.]|nr:hypothetical protein [Aquisalinus sp.]